MAKERSGKIVVILILVILILLAVILYSFVIAPSINGYIVGKQLEARDITLQTMIAQVQQQGFTQISDGQGNTIVLVPLQQDGQAQQG